MIEAQRPHVAYLINSLNFGGAETLVAEMAGALTDAFKIFVICLDEPGILAGGLRKAGIPVFCLWRQPGIDLNVAFRLAAFWRRHKIEIIHAHQCTPWFYGALSRMLFRKPRLLFEEHGRFYPEVKNPGRVLVNRVFIRGRTHRLVAVSEDVKRRLVDYEGLSADRIAVIYNGVRPVPALSRARKAEIRKSQGVPPDAFLVGSVGRIDPIKNYPLLVESFAAAAQCRNEFRGILIGDGPERTKIEALVRSCRLQSRFGLTGYRSDARDLVQCLDLFVLCSLSEGTSVALLEAISAGIPVVVTAVGGNPEIVEHGKTGWVIPSDSKKSLTSAILEASADREKTRRYAEAGKRRYEEKFSFDAMISNYRAIYRDLVSLQTPGRQFKLFQSMEGVNGTISNRTDHS